eukprot:436750-Rhodomonas_salina.2
MPPPPPSGSTVINPAPTEALASPPRRTASQPELEADLSLPEALRMTQLEVASPLSVKGQRTECRRAVVRLPENSEATALRLARGKKAELTSCALILDPLIAGISPNLAWKRCAQSKYRSAQKARGTTRGKLRVVEVGPLGPLGLFGLPPGGAG